MDAQAMIRDLLALLALAAGYPVGLLFFGSLQRVARAMAAGRMSAVLWQGLRMALLAAVLWAFARMGALMLLAVVAGMMVARQRVLARAQP
jgi:hypothetical protein